jgi:hypothetical protein
MLSDRPVRGRMAAAVRTRYRLRDRYRNRFRNRFKSSILMPCVPVKGRQKNSSKLVKSCGGMSAAANPHGLEGGLGNMMGRTWRGHSSSRSTPNMADNNVKPRDKPTCCAWLWQWGDAVSRRRWKRWLDARLFQLRSISASLYFSFALFQLRSISASLARLRHPWPRSGRAHGYAAEQSI